MNRGCALRRTAPSTMILLDPDLEPESPHGRRPVRGGPDLDPAPKTTSVKRVGALAQRRNSTRKSKTTGPDFRLPSVPGLARFLAAAQAAVRLKGQVTVLLTTDAAIARAQSAVSGEKQGDGCAVVSGGGSGRGRDGGGPGDQRDDGDGGRRRSRGIRWLSRSRCWCCMGCCIWRGSIMRWMTGRWRGGRRLLRARLGLPQGLIERAGIATNLRLTKTKSRSFDFGMRFAQDDKSIGARTVRHKKAEARMSALAIFMVVLLAAVETLASYISRVYAEFGKILTREIEENLDAWEELVEPQLGLSREHAAISRGRAAATGAGDYCAGVRRGSLRSRAAHGRPTYAEIAQAVLGVVLVVVFCNQLLPSLLFNRTRGRWAARLVWPIRLLLWLMTPITRVCALLLFGCVAGGEAGERGGRDGGRRGGAARSRRRRGDSGRERPRPGALGCRVWRQAGARGDDAAAGGFCGAGVDRRWSSFWSC